MKLKKETEQNSSKKGQNEKQCKDGTNIKKTQVLTTLEYLPPGAVDELPKQPNSTPLIHPPLPWGPANRYKQPRSIAIMQLNK